MKKLVVVLCLALMGVFCLSACGKKKEETVPETSEVQEVVGGWTLDDLSQSLLTDEEKAVFDKAMEGYTGMGFEPICCLGTQIVSGTNYMFLCKGTMVTAEPSAPELKIVVVYNDLEGNASVTNVSDFDITSVSENLETAAENIVGGWAFNQELKGTVEETVQTAFDKATEGLEGALSIPLVILGRQVVNGENVAILCADQAVTAEENPEVTLSIKVLYIPTSGNPEITSSVTLDLGAYNQAE